MFIDVVNAGWVPIYNVNLSEDVPGYMAAPATALDYPWTHLICGHLGRLATRDDVALHQQYIADIEASAREALATVNPMPFYLHYGENAWAGVRAHLNTVTDLGERQEFDMSEPLDWNARTVAEFRANEGRVGGVFEGAPLVLLHHRGRRSGREHVTPVMYLPHETDPDVIYVFATKGGAPTSPDWYYNLTAAGDGSVERGTGTYRVSVRDLTGAERDRTYAEQARRYPGFAEYERQTTGVRTIPVLELTRA